MDLLDLLQLESLPDPICRCCLSVPPQQVQFESIFNNDDSLLDSLVVFGGVQIRKDDGLPDKICADCSGHIRKCVEFRQRTSDSDIALRQFAAKCSSQEQEEELVEDVEYLIDSEGGDSIVGEDVLAEQEPVLEAHTRLPCHLCTCRFKDQASLDHHVQLHSSRTSLKRRKEAKYSCGQCQESFGAENDLRVHESSLHSSSATAAACSGCGKEFKTRAQLTRHLPTHFKVKPYECDVCRQQFPEMASLTRHYRQHSHERKERRFVCSVCSKKYFDAHSLKVHARTHTGEKPWECTLCDKTFADVRYLHSHERTHTIDRQFGCDECGARFRHRSTLATHLRTHSGEKPYVCVICSNAFGQAANLNLHMRSHTGEKPFECATCRRGFPSSSSLASHLRSHTGEKPFACPVCGQTFTRRYTREQHVRTHSDEPGYACGECEKAFLTRVQLKTHVSKAHRTTTSAEYKCENCSKSWTTQAQFRSHMRRQHKSLMNSQHAQDQKKDALQERADSDAELNECEALVDELLASVQEEPHKSDIP